jgi:hypothetical protein
MFGGSAGSGASAGAPKDIIYKRRANRFMVAYFDSHKVGAYVSEGRN